MTCPAHQPQDELPLPAALEDGVQDRLAVEHLRQLGELSECPDQVLDAA